MNVRKGVQAPWKGRLIYPKRLRALFFSIPSSSQASTPSLRGPANDLHNAIAKRSCCVDGWVGGDILPPSLFLIFKYVNKQHVFVPKMGIKVAYAF